MTGGGYELISPSTRRAFRELATDIYQRPIAEYWQDEGFKSVTVDETEDPSVRRRTYDSYARAVDWTSEQQVDRVLRVFEQMLRFHRRQPGHQDSHFDAIRAHLDADGLRLDGETCKIQWRRPPGLENSLHNLAEASGILAELERVRRSLPVDPEGAIGAAKQLVEATAKVVLTERGEPFDEKAEMPELVRRAQQALRLHPSSTTDGPDGADALKKILGGVSAIAIGIAELRNKHGAGHGRVRTPAGLGVRHAHLAVNAAITWCQLLLDTLADPYAPWRRDADGGGTLGQAVADMRGEPWP